MLGEEGGVRDHSLVSAGWTMETFTEIQGHDEFSHRQSLWVPEACMWRYLVGTFYMGLEAEKEDQAQGGDMRHQHGET